MGSSNKLFDNKIYFIVVINLIIFLLTSSQSQISSLILYFGSLYPLVIVKKLYIWQFFTYMFLHGSTMHIFINMFVLINFGIHLEYNWGFKKFLIYYLFCGIGAGIFVFLIRYFSNGGVILLIKYNQNNFEIFLDLILKHSPLQAFLIWDFSFLFF